MDLDNNCGNTNGTGGIVVENNADFQPWFGFSSAGRTDLIYARQNDTGSINLGGVANTQVATAGTFAQHNRTIEIAMKWADIAASVDQSRQPGGDIVNSIAPGFTFGCEPLLISVDYNAQAFIGPNQYSPGNGVDAYSRDVKLLDPGQTTLSLTLTNWSGTTPNQIALAWQGTDPAYGVEVSTRLNPSSWVQAGSPFLDVDGWYKVVLPGASQHTAFYRLFKP
jgi:hypothetical protein